MDQRLPIMYPTNYSSQLNSWSKALKSIFVGKTYNKERKRTVWGDSLGH